MISVAVPVGVSQRGVTRVVEHAASISDMVAGVCIALLVKLIGQERAQSIILFLLLLLRSAMALLIRAIDLLCYFLRVVGAHDAVQWLEKTGQPFLLRWELKTLYPDLNSRRKN